MAFFIAFILALVTKPFLNSSLCKGEFDFFKTYVVYGVGGSIAISVIVFWVFGGYQLSTESGRIDEGLPIVFRIWALTMAVYFAGIGLAVAKIKERTRSPLMSLYISLLLLSMVALVVVSMFIGMIYSVVYGVTLFVLYRTVWEKQLFKGELKQDS
ncbi:hypothetical protein [Pseudomonas purpurea]|uniref:hypothetical protein n=1 Tax=Pseudomonas purpurea TaxID=3136737 RepID=UPI003264B315